MRIDLMNIDEFIKANHVKEVKNPVFFASDKTPNDDSFFSYSIFGMTEIERKNTFGYIDLGNYYIHPLIATNFVRIGSLKKVINGEKYAVIVNGKIQIVPENFKGAETGIDFIYKNFEKINWLDEIEEEEIESLDKKTRLEFLKNVKKDEFFITKWLVLPPAYRAENSTDRTMGDQINQIYKDLLNKTLSMKTGFSFSLFGDQTRVAIQNLLNKLYLTTLAPISGKNLQSSGEFKGTPKTALFRKHLLGKTIDFSASNVITSPSVSMSKDSKKTPVPFGYGRFPMATLLALFQPFFANAIVDFMDRYIRIFYQDYGDEIQKIDLGQFNIDEAERMIKTFIKSHDERFKPLEISYKRIDGKNISRTMDLLEFNSESDAKELKNFTKRPITLTDLMYIIAEEILEDKHVYITRYPVINFQNVYPSKIKIATTVKTAKKWILMRTGDNTIPKYYENYPVPTSDFIDVMVVGNTYLSAMGGDYDGDMVYMKAVFSKEANDEAERLIFSKTNVLGASGNITRGLSKLGKEAAISLYELTKMEEK